MRRSIALSYIQPTSRTWKFSGDAWAREGCVAVIGKEQQLHRNETLVSSSYDASGYTIVLEHVAEEDEVVRKL